MGGVEVPICKDLIGVATGVGTGVEQPQTGVEDKHPAHNFKVGDRVEEIADPEEGVGVVERFESGRYIVRFLQEPRRVARYDSSELRMAPPDRATLGIVVPPPPPDDSNPKARRLK